MTSLKMTARPKDLSNNEYLGAIKLTWILGSLFVAMGITEMGECSVSLLEVTEGPLVDRAGTASITHLSWLSKTSKNKVAQGKQHSQWV